MSQGERNNIDYEAALEEKMIKATKTGNEQDLEDLRTFLDGFEGAEIYAEVLDAADKITEKNKLPPNKNLFQVRGILIGRANAISTQALAEGQNPKEAGLLMLRDSMNRFNIQTQTLKKEALKAKYSAKAKAEPKQESKEKKKDKPTKEEELIDAISSGDASKFEKALKDGADPNARGKDGKSAVATAVNSGNAKMVAKLLDSGAQLNIAGASKSSFDKMHVELMQINQTYANMLGDAIGMAEDLKNQAGNKSSGSGPSRKDGATHEKQISKINELWDKNLSGQLKISQDAEKLKDQAYILEVMEVEYTQRVAQMLKFGDDAGQAFGFSSNFDGEERGYSCSHQPTQEELDVLKEVVIEKVDAAFAEAQDVSGGYETIQEVLQSVDVNINQLFLEAVRRGDLATVDSLIGQVDLNAGFGGFTPLSVALETGNEHLSAKFLALGANPNLSTISGQAVSAYVETASSKEATPEIIVIADDLIKAANSEYERGLDRGISTYNRSSTPDPNVREPEAELVGVALSRSPEDPSAERLQATGRQNELGG